MPERTFGSEPSSSLNLITRKSFSGINENPVLLDAPVLILLVLATADAEATGTGPVLCGRALIPALGSAEAPNEGFLTNDKNKCRQTSSGISELSTKTSRN